MKKIKIKIKIKKTGLSETTKLSPVWARAMQKKILCPTRILTELNASSESHVLETHWLLIVALLITRWECLAMAEGERMEKNHCTGESWVNHISVFSGWLSKVRNLSLVPLITLAVSPTYGEVGELSNSKQ